MELWKEKLKKTDLIKNISGAEKNKSVCDYLFYTNFSETEAESFFDIFNGFNRYYSTQTAAKDLRQLGSNLEKQIAATAVPPLELILYTSRVINKYIENNEHIFNSLTAILQSYIKDNYPSISCMAGAWEWKNQLLLLAEACGRAKDDKAIGIMMENYNRICDLFGQSSKVQKAYVRMLLHTQDEKNINYMADIVSSYQFVSNPECLNLLKRPIRTAESFVSQFEKEFLEELFVRKIPSGFKTKVERIFGVNDSTGAESFVWEWGFKSKESLFKLSQINNKNELPDIIDMVITHYPEITGRENQQRALYTMAVKAAYSEDYQTIGKVCELCKKVLEENENLGVGAYLGLSELEVEEVSKAFEVVMEIDSYYSGAVVLGNYLRFRKTLLVSEFIGFIEDKFISCNWNSIKLGEYIQRLKTVIEMFDGNKKQLSSATAFNSRLMDLIDMAFSKGVYDISTYNYGIDILILVAEASHQHKNGVIKVLERIKNLDYNVPGAVLKRIDGLIKKLQPPASPQ
ncbi:MAG: hypothetical protein IJ300_08750 [Clostridia bacterium]|nr:hypothetical protein [Clostridia bacterium]